MESEGGRRWQVLIEMRTEEGTMLSAGCWTTQVKRLSVKLFSLDYFQFD